MADGADEQRVETFRECSTLEEVLAAQRLGMVPINRTVNNRTLSAGIVKENIETNLNGRKPGLTVPTSSSPLSSLRAHLWTNIDQSSGDQYANRAKEFVYKICRGLRVEASPRVWESCGVTLMGAETAGNALNFFEVTEERLDELTPPVTAWGDESDAALLILLLSPSRISMSHANQKMDLVKRLTQEYQKTSPRIKKEFTALQFENWHDSPEMKKLMSAFDSYMVTHPNHALSGARMATLHWRGRGNAAINTLASLAEPFDLDLAGFSLWMWTPALLTQMYTMFSQPGLEIARTDSYLHYVVAMGIVTRSPFSVTQNPDLYALMHIVGLTLTVPRSEHTLVPAGGITQRVLRIGVIMAYALSGGSTYVPGLAGRDLTEEEKEQLEEKIRSSGRNDDVMNTKDGLSWYLMEDQEGVFLRAAQYSTSIWAGFHGGRDNSIKKYLKTQVQPVMALAQRPSTLFE